MFLIHQLKRVVCSLAPIATAAPKALEKSFGTIVESGSSVEL